MSETSAGLARDGPNQKHHVDTLNIGEEEEEFDLQLIYSVD